MRHDGTSIDSQCRNDFGLDTDVTSEENNHSAGLCEGIMVTLTGPQSSTSEMKHTTGPNDSYVHNFRTYTQNARGLYV